MAFFSFKMRVSTNLLFQISSENIFDSSGSIDLVRTHDWQFFPLSIQKISRYPICQFVHSCSLWLYFRRKFALFSTFCCSLYYKIIFLFSCYFTPEFNLLNLLSNAESFNSLKYDESKFLAKSYSCLLK